MKKHTAVLIIMLSFVLFTPSASAFWSWGDISEAFQKTVLGQLFFLSDEEKEEREQEKENDVYFAETLTSLEQIKKELKILQEGGIEALKEYERSQQLSFKAKPFEFKSEKVKEILERVKGSGDEFSTGIIGNQDSEESVSKSASKETTEEATTGEPEEVPVIAEKTLLPEIPGNFSCGTIISEFSPTGGYYFANLSYGSQNQHTEILRYKIKWYDGTWSNWFLPGVNDRDWQGDRHFWGNFGDHSYKVEHCQNYQYSPPQ